MKPHWLNVFIISFKLIYENKYYDLDAIFVNVAGVLI